jgi:ssDNA-binding Zn-finger/Zn-ribbon topoisomerase 1
VKRSRFFCEHCHHEVRPNAKVCPHCGRFFEAVRCPVCNYVGQSGDFIHGCPNCGYAGADTGRRKGFEQVDYEPRASGQRPSAGTPGWVWPLAIGILLLAFLGLVLIYLRL